MARKYILTEKLKPKRKAYTEWVIKALVEQKWKIKASVKHKHTHRKSECVCAVWYIWFEETNVTLARMTSNGHQSQFSFVNDLKFRTVHLCHLLPYRRSSFENASPWYLMSTNRQLTIHTLTQCLANLIHQCEPSIYYAIMELEKRKKKPKHRERERVWNVCWTLPPYKTARLIFILSYFHLVIK